MNTNQTLLSPADLQSHLHDASLLLVDLTTPQHYARAHIPGAVFVPYADLVRGGAPAPGLLPDTTVVHRLLSSLGVSERRHVVAYDDEGGGKACRLLWTLHVFGHNAWSLLDGGIGAWLRQCYATESAGDATSDEFKSPAQPAMHSGVQIMSPPATMLGDAHARSSQAATNVGPFLPPLHSERVADFLYVLAHLDDPQVALLDARTPDEYTGLKVHATRGGHIPGAVNLNWQDTLDKTRDLRLKPDVELRAMLEAHGLTPDKEIIPYCQTHHRSAHSFFVLHHLGYQKIRAYPGSWSEWGNRPDAPVEV